MDPATPMDHTIARNRTKNAPVYRWRKTDHGTWELRAYNDLIAEVVPYQDPDAPTGIRGFGARGVRYQVWYVWTDKARGNKQSSYCVLASPSACMNWAENELRAFWNPPRLGER